jgi:hypothetical protein
MVWFTYASALLRSDPLPLDRRIEHIARDHLENFLIERVPWSVVARSVAYVRFNIMVYSVKCSTNLEATEKHFVEIISQMFETACLRTCNRA